MRKLWPSIHPDVVSAGLVLWALPFQPQKGYHLSQPDELANGPAEFDKRPVGEVFAQPAHEVGICASCPSALPE